MTIDKYLSHTPEKFRGTARELHGCISKRADRHSAEVRGHGMIGYDKGTDDFVLVGLAVRSAGVMLYASADILTAHANVLDKKRTGKTCLRLHQLDDVPPKVLSDIIRQPFKKKQMVYGTC